MKKWIFAFSFLFATSAQCCVHAGHAEMMVDSTQRQAPQIVSSSDSQYLEPASIQASRLVVKAMDIKGFDAESLKKLKSAFVVLEKVVNSLEFKNRVINFKNNQNQRSFASNNGYSNEQIFATFMDGRETLQPNTPGEMNYFLKLYYKRYSKVIGWTNGDINTINVNWKFFKNFKPSDVAGNLAHEWTHKLGFGHASAAEHDSAPYAIGYIVREMGERYLKGEELH
jgi:hypothetical protein